MRIARLSALGALALILFSAGCNGGGSTTTAPVPLTPLVPPAPVLLRFIQGSPGTGTGGSGTVDVCVDTQPFALTQPFSETTFPAPSVNYGHAAPGLDLVNAPHMISVYNGIGAGAGAECATAPGAYLGAAPIATALLPTGSNKRFTIVLGGTSASGTVGLFIWSEPTYAVTPAGFTAIIHNAAPAFSTGKANGIGFGLCSATVTPCTVPMQLIGAEAIAGPTPSTPSVAHPNGEVLSSMAAIPAGLYDGIGVAAGTPAPITSVPSPNPLPLQAYVVQLYAADAPAGGLNLITFCEQTVGFGF
jgi:hypothetical protein